MANEVKGAQLKAQQTASSMQRQERVSAPSRWAKMLIPSTLLLVGLAMGASAAGNSKKTQKPKEKPKIEQTMKPPCSKKSKKITKNGGTAIFTAEICDDSDMLKTSFTGARTITQPLQMPTGLTQPLIKKKIYLGIESCFSWLIKGEADSFRFLVIPDVTTGPTSSTLKDSWVDTGILVDPNVSYSVNQSKNCGWIVSFSADGDKTSFIIFEDGKVQRIPSK